MRMMETENEVGAGGADDDLWFMNDGWWMILIKHKYDNMLLIVNGAAGC